MKLSETIEGYEGMTAEERLAALEAMDAPDGSETERLRAAVDKASSQAAEFKRALRERQTEEERLAAERAEADKAKDELIKSLTREKNLAQLKGSFSIAGDLAGEMAEAFLDSDHEKFAAAFGKFITAHDKAVEVEKLKGTPRPSGGSDPGKAMTKEEFAKLSYTQAAKLAAENPELYKVLSE